MILDLRVNVLAGGSARVSREVFPGFSEGVTAEGGITDGRIKGYRGVGWK